MSYMAMHVGWVSRLDKIAGIMRTYASSSTASLEGHEEWLLDDAIADTFPASDPVSHSQPGSIVNTRYASHESRDAHGAAPVGQSNSSE